MTEVERLRVQVDAMERVIVEQRRQLAGFIAGQAIPAHIAGSAFGGLKHAVCAGVKHLKSVQLNDRAAEGLEQYAKQLREDQVIYLNPCAGMPPEKALPILRGRKAVICGLYEL